jgi:hypothetical protein
MDDINNKQRSIGADTRALNRSALVPKTAGGAGMGEKRANTFTSAGAAARDAIERFNPSSIKEKREYGGTIYRLPGSNKFTYVLPANVQSLGFSGGHVSSAQDIPAGAVEVGRWHTHGGPENYTDEDFSPVDLKLARNRGVPSWVGTPKGAIKEAIPIKSGAVILDTEPAEGTRPNIRFVPW